MNKLFLPYDIYERHRKVGTYIKSSQTVLDVGGELNHLSQFSSPKKIIVANLASGDVVIQKDKLPFAKNSFDVVTAIDVLEHIPKNKRAKFINTLANIASHSAILSFPIGTKKHLLYEKKTAKWLKVKGQDVAYLSEHLKYGLPTYPEMTKMTKGKKCQVTFSGDIFINKILFRIYMFDPKVKYLSKLIYFVKFLFNLLSNPFLYLFLTSKQYSQNVNRAYLVIVKNK